MPMHHSQPLADFGHLAFLDDKALCFLEILAILRSERLGAWLVWERHDRRPLGRALRVLFTNPLLTDVLDHGCWCRSRRSVLAGRGAFGCCFQLLEKACLPCLYLFSIEAIFLCNGLRGDAFPQHSLNHVLAKCWILWIPGGLRSGFGHNL